MDAWDELMSPVIKAVYCELCVMNGSRRKSVAFLMFLATFLVFHPRSERFVLLMNYCSIHIHQSRPTPVLFSSLKHVLPVPLLPCISKSRRHEWGHRIYMRQRGISPNFLIGRVTLDATRLLAFLIAISLFVLFVSNFCSCLKVLLSCCTPFRLQSIILSLQHLIIYLTLADTLIWTGERKAISKPSRILNLDLEVKRKSEKKRRCLDSQLENARL